MALALRSSAPLLAVAVALALALALAHLPLAQHSSASDPQKRDKDWFRVDEQEAHGRIARKCLELMSREGALKRNPCGFKEPGVARSEVDRRVVDEHLSSEVQYACRYWVYHVEKSEGHFRDVHPVLVFLQTHLLHWFEALSWMGRISEGVTMIITLRSLLDVSHCQLSDLFHTDPKLDL
jgi:hypothetical protein